MPADGEINVPADREIEDTFDRLLREFEAAWPLRRWQNVGVVIGCSGGADSVALAIAMHRLRSFAVTSVQGFVTLAHFNHRLRGAESDADEAFVRELANDLKFPFISQSASDQAHDESSLRRSRLDFLRQVAAETGSRYITVAHSADDTVETVLHHLFRGTGPSGLTGIPKHRPLGDDLVLIRPLLQTRRELIRNALRSIGQTWREDSSNAQSQYTRNWIRNELIPIIQSQFPNASDAILRASASIGDLDDFVNEQARVWLSRNLVDDRLIQVRKDSEVATPVVVAAMKELWHSQRWPLGEMSREHWLRVANAIREAQTDSRFTLPGSIDVEIGESQITLTK